MMTPSARKRLPRHADTPAGGLANAGPCRLHAPAAGPKTLLLAGLLLALPTQAPPAADRLREAQIAMDMGSNGTGADTTVQLEAAGGRFAALYRAAIPKERKGAVALFSGADNSPDAVESLQGLRKNLPEQGWDSLSLQPPVWEQGASAPDYRALIPEAAGRLAAGVAYLKSKGQEPIVLVGYAMGGPAVLRYLAEQADPSVAAAVLIDLPGMPEDQARILADLARVKAPILEIIGSRGPSLADDRVLARKRAMHANPRSRQILVADSPAGLRDIKELLVNRIHGWLSRVVTPPGPSSGGAE